MVKYAQEVAQIVSDEVRRRAKSLRDFYIVEVLENIVDLLSLGIGKNKALRELREESKGEDRNLENYVGKVIGKLDRITVAMM